MKKLLLLGNALVLTLIIGILIIIKLITINDKVILKNNIEKSIDVNNTSMPLNIPEDTTTTTIETTTLKKQNTTKKTNIKVTTKNQIKTTNTKKVETTTTIQNNINKENVSNNSVNVNIKNNNSSVSSTHEIKKNETTTVTTAITTVPTTTKRVSEYKDEAMDKTIQNETTNKEVVNYLNQYRTEVNVSNLSYSKELSIAAEIRAIEMAKNNYTDHKRPDGRSPSTVMQEINYSYRVFGENIASGVFSASQVSNEWKKSKIHYDIIISTKYSRVGVGYYKYNNNMYWVTLFTN